LESVSTIEIAKSISLSETKQVGKRVVWHAKGYYYLSILSMDILETTIE